ncbi:hypothetical protein [Novosphingobium sp. NBM11]|uniref:hypothetical protein n=1 Tax=Novosphingobium sp. NBM11 TaxID=2596914 RepID=UPI0018924D8E|nr:hypothetical protein [Novosphingobium sp. NBM11]
MNRQHASLTSPSNRVSKRNPKGSASRLTRGLDIDMAAGNNQPVESGIVFVQGGDKTSHWNASEVLSVAE